MTFTKFTFTQFCEGLEKLQFRWFSDQFILPKITGARGSGHGQRALAHGAQVGAVRRSNIGPPSCGLLAVWSSYIQACYWDMERQLSSREGAWASAWGRMAPAR